MSKTNNRYKKYSISFIREKEGEYIDFIGERGGIKKTFVYLYEQYITMMKTGRIFGHAEGSSAYSQINSYEIVNILKIVIKESLAEELKKLSSISSVGTGEINVEALDKVVENVFMKQGQLITERIEYAFSKLERNTKNNLDDMFEAVTNRFLKFIDQQSGSKQLDFNDEKQVIEEKEEVSKMTAFGINKLFMD